MQKDKTDRERDKVELIGTFFQLLVASTCTKEITERETDIYFLIRTNRLLASLTTLSLLHSHVASIGRMI
jgi:hypothetical protein